MSDIQIRNGTLMQIGSCLSCGNGCSNNRDAEIMNMKFVEITVGNLKFRLCGDCKNTLKNLRAKILFAEGAHKVGGQRPKFQRQQATRMPELSRVAKLEPSNEYLDVPEFLRRDCSDSDVGENPASTWYNKNYGVDLSTLATMIEQGQL